MQQASIGSVFEQYQIGMEPDTLLLVQVAIVRQIVTSDEVSREHRLQALFAR